jgi:glycerol uptake facilitator-like aquaporin
MRAALDEAIGTALLLAAVVGSGIMGERLAQGNVALALLANSLATGFALVALITAFATRSGAHFNPVVTLAFALRAGFPWRQVPAYVVAQFLGALLGVLAAHAMFDLPLLQLSAKARDGLSQGFSEWVATLGLLTTILLTRRTRPQAVATSVGLYITAAYWFTASTSFANPAVTLARAFSDTFAGIGLASVPMFVAAQMIAVPAALGLVRLLAGREQPVSRLRMSGEEVGG